MTRCSKKLKMKRGGKCRTLHENPFSPYNEISQKCLDPLKFFQRKRARLKKNDQAFVLLPERCILHE